MSACPSRSPVPYLQEEFVLVELHAVIWQFGACPHMSACPCTAIISYFIRSYLPFHPQAQHKLRNHSKRGLEIVRIIRTLCLRMCMHMCMNTLGPANTQHGKTRQIDIQRSHTHERLHVHDGRPKNTVCDLHVRKTRCVICT